MTETSLSRRTFIQNTSAMAIALGTPRKILGANKAIVLGIIGTGGRGRRLLKALTRIPDFRVAAVCDLVDERMDLAAAM